MSGSTARRMIWLQHAGARQRSLRVSRRTQHSASSGRRVRPQSLCRDGSGSLGHSVVMRAHFAIVALALAACTSPVDVGKGGNGGGHATALGGGNANGGSNAGGDGSGSAGGSTGNIGGGSTGNIGGGRAGNAGGGSAGGGGSAPVTSLDQFCTELAVANCFNFVRCKVTATFDGCATLFGGDGDISFFGPCQPGARNDLDAGLVLFDHVAADACLGALDSPACLSQADIVSHCPNLLTGQLPTNGACAVDAECSPADYCHHASGSCHDLAGDCRSYSTCGGTCTARIAVGEPVAIDEECVDGATPSYGVCIRPTLPLGAPCNNPDGGIGILPCANGFCQGFESDTEFCSDEIGVEGGPIFDHDAGIWGCGPGLYQDDDDLCIRMGGIGAACDPYRSADLSPGACEYDLWCNGAVQPPTCQLRGHSGAACASDPDCLDSVPCVGGVKGDPVDGGWVLGTCGSISQLGAPVHLRLRRGSRVLKRAAVCRSSPSPCR